MTDDAGSSVDHSPTTGPDPNAVYEALANRRVMYDQMMWQVPALSFAAQSFLVTVAVDSATSLPIRILVLLLAIGSGVLSMQLMAKQRFHEQVDTSYLRRWEDTAGIRPVAGTTPHDHAISHHPGKATALGVTPNRWVRMSSYKLWMWGLRVFLGAMIFLLIWVLTLT